MMSEEDLSLYNIYKITCNITLKSYIGITKRTVEQRWRGHLSECRNGSQLKFKHAIRLYGEASFSLETITTCFGLENAHELEKHYIEMFDTYYNGYNSTLGGLGANGVVWSNDESRVYKYSKKMKHLSESKNPIDRLLNETTKLKMSEVKHNSGKNSIVIDGVVYNSLRQAANILNTSLYKLQSYLRTGIPYSEPRSNVRSEYKILDLVFATREDAAKFMGVCPHNLSWKIKSLESKGILKEFMLERSVSSLPTIPK